MTLIVKQNLANLANVGLKECHPHVQVMKSLDAAHNTLLGVPSPTEVNSGSRGEGRGKMLGTCFFDADVDVFFWVGKYVNCN